MTAIDPNPAVDKCGVSPAKTINATLTPGCKSGGGNVEIKP